MRLSISAEEKLVCTLRNLANGESVNSLKYQFCVHETAVGKLRVPVCETMYNDLATDYMKCPSTKNNRSIQWMKLTDGNFQIAMLHLMENTLV